MTGKQQSRIVFQTKPDGFAPRVEVVGCFVEYKGKMLLLHRQDHKYEGNTWGVPAGKRDGGEELVAAMLRELYEETGIKLVPAELTYFDRVFVRYPSFDFIYHIFHTKLGELPSVTINQAEHKDYQFIAPQGARLLPLILGERECIELFYNQVYGHREL